MRFRPFTRCLQFLCEQRRDPWSSCLFKRGEKMQRMKSVNSEGRRSDGQSIEKYVYFKLVSRTRNGLQVTNTSHGLNQLPFHCVPIPSMCALPVNHIWWIRCERWQWPIAVPISICHWNSILKQRKRLNFLSFFRKTWNFQYSSCTFDVRVLSSWCCYCWKS